MVIASEPARSVTRYVALDSMVDDSRPAPCPAGTALQASPQETEEEANSLSSLRRPTTRHHLAGMEQALGSGESSGRRSAKPLMPGGNKRSIEGVGGPSDCASVTVSATSPGAPTTPLPPGRVQCSAASRVWADLCLFNFRLRCLTLPAECAGAYTRLSYSVCVAGHVWFVAGHV